MNVGKWMLGAVVTAATLGLGTTAAHAAQFGIYVGSGPAAYVPPCPGPGYEWAAGYYNGGYWVPGRWNFVGVRGGYYRDDVRVYRDRDWDRDRDWHHDRDWDRERYRGGEHFRDHDDHERGWDRGRR